MEHLQLFWGWLAEVTGWDLSLLIYLTGMLSTGTLAILWKGGRWTEHTVRVEVVRPWLARRKANADAAKELVELALIRRVEEVLLQRQSPVVDQATRPAEKAVVPLLACATCGFTTESPTLFNHHCVGGTNRRCINPIKAIPAKDGEVH